MMTLLNKIQLTLTQWILLAMAAVIGGLVLALKVQGSALHKAQLQLLEQNIKVVDDKDDKAVSDARTIFNKEYTAYVKAKLGGNP